MSSADERSFPLTADILWRPLGETMEIYLFSRNTEIKVQDAVFFIIAIIYYIYIYYINSFVTKSQRPVHSKLWGPV